MYFPKFTYDGYARLVECVQKSGYKIQNYHNDYFGKSCILRHDVDFDIQKAADFSEFEKELGVQSTYFLLVSTDFYNLMSNASQKAMQRILKNGHEIGLHFDEVKYLRGGVCVIENILDEIKILSLITGKDISVVSMHRPSKKTLESDLQIPGIVNSYSKKFFNDYKYLSDSHMRWREPALQIIDSGNFEKIHLLTHPFWYNRGEEQTIEQMLKDFLDKSRVERYAQMNDNFTDLEAIIPRSMI